MRRLVPGELDLRIRPAAGGAAGALILNHGRGADEHDLAPLLDELDPDRRLLGITTGAPFTGIAPGGRHWYVVERVGYPHAETFAHSYRALGERLDAALAEHGLGWSRSVIGGFSQGAVMSYAIGLGPGRPTPGGVLAFSGFVPEVEGWEPELDGRESLRALVHHGARDAVIDAEFGRSAAARLSGAGIGVEQLETEAGHWLPPEAIEPARELIGKVLDRSEAPA